MNQYEQFILSHLTKNDYILGKELNILLQKQFSISPESGRKIIQRSVGSKIIKSSSPITFGNGQYAYLIKDKALSNASLLKIFELHRPPLYRIIKIMEKNKGIISIYDLHKIASTPVISGISKSDSAAKLISELKVLGLADEVQDDNGIFYLISPSVIKRADSLMLNQYNNMRIDAMFVPDILKSLQKFNLITGNNSLYRNKLNCAENIFKENLYWDAIAYTKSTGINPLYGVSADTLEKQTLAVIDIVVSRAYNQEDLDGFMCRIQTLSNSLKQRRKKVLPIIIYTSLESTIVESRIRKLGFISFDLGSIYGSKIYQIIQNLIKIKRKENAETGEVKESEQEIESILKSMRSAGQEENLNSIKGDLFEFLIYPLLKLLYSDSSIVHGRKIKESQSSSKRQLEFDYIVSSYRLEESVIFELKGYSQSNIIPLGSYTQRNTVNWFFNNTFQVAKTKLRTENPNHRITGCYITTSKFDKEGYSYLELMNQGKLKPSEVDCWYDGDKLLELLKKKKLKDVQRIIERYYIKEA